MDTRLVAPRGRGTLLAVAVAAPGGAGGCLVFGSDAGHSDGLLATWPALYSTITIRPRLCLTYRLRRLPLGADTIS